MLKWTIGILSVVLLNASAEAALTYSLELDQSNVSLLQGEFYTSDIFLIERATDGSSLDLDAARTVTFNIVTDGSAAAAITSASGAFEVRNSSAIANGFNVVNTVLFGTPPPAVQISSTERRILVGSVTIEGLNIGSSLVSILDPSANATNINLSFDDGATFPASDSLVFPSSPTTLITVTAVPEPGVIGFGLLVVGAIGLRSVRQRRAARIS